MVRCVHDAAFGRSAEAVLVNALRAAGVVICSLVAEVDGRVVGHVLFSPATLAGADGSTQAMAGLGPVAVSPACEGQSIGAALIAAGLEACRAAGYGAAVVLGHPAYYPRFGFQRASACRIRWEHDAPDEAFMAMTLRPGGLDGGGVVVGYRPEFDGV